VKCCKRCLIPEARIQKGWQEFTNLDPISGLCLSCLTAKVRASVKPMDCDPADYKRAQSGEKE